MTSALAVAVVALFVAVFALVRTFTGRGLSLSAIAVQAVAYGQQMGGAPADRLRSAVEAAKRLDAGDNMVRDFSDAQLRIAIEAELGRATR